MRATQLFVTAALLLVFAHRLPAPIQVIPESPTPAPEESVRSKPKRPTKPKVTSDNSESSTKQSTPSTTPKNQATPKRNPFDGTWVGTFKGMPMDGDVEFTITVSGMGTVESDTARVGTRAIRYHTHQYHATCDGRTTKWIDTWSTWTLTP